jgi:hypothetical protein
LIIYDEVHLLPAPVFRVTAELQSRRRLGLTATLIREDGLEKDVFALIGPKRYDAPWRELEGQGWIAAADCTEIPACADPGAGYGIRAGSPPQSVSGRGGKSPQAAGGSGIAEAGSRASDSGDRRVSSPVGGIWRRTPGFRC